VTDEIDRRADLLELADQPFDVRFLRRGEAGRPRAAETGSATAIVSRRFERRAQIVPESVVSGTRERRRQACAQLFTADELTQVHQIFAEGKSGSVTAVDVPGELRSGGDVGKC